MLWQLKSVSCLRLKMTSFILQSNAVIELWVLMMGYASDVVFAFVSVFVSAFVYVFVCAFVFLSIFLFVFLLFFLCLSLCLLLRLTMTSPYHPESPESSWVTRSQMSAG